MTKTKRMLYARPIKNQDVSLAIREVLKGGKELMPQWAVEAGAKVQHRVIKASYPDGTEELLKVEAYIVLPADRQL
jgi:hypothetical protein